MNDAPRLAVLISGRGSNLQAILDATRAGAVRATVAIVVSNRADSTMWKVLGKREDSQKWETLASGTGKAGNVGIEPTEAGKPERLLVMIQLYKNNELYGQPSDPQYVTFNP